MNVKKSLLYRLIDALPEEEIETAKRFLEFLVAQDTIMHALLTAPYDDEPDSKEERFQAKKAWEEYSQGNALSHEEVSREIFGE